MANFDQALAFVLENEGGFSDNVHDRGGATQCGISQRFLDATGGKYGSSVRDLTSSSIRDIYYHEFWLKAPFTSIWNQRIANYAFDTCVMSGIQQGVKLVQRATWSVVGFKAIPDDGVMGVKTLDAIQKAGFMLVYALPAVRAGFCRLLCEIRPEQKEFLNGWLKRCYRI